MRIKVLFLLFFFFLAVTNIFADTVILKSGATVEGKIVGQTDDSIKLEVEGIPLTYYVGDIDSINGQKVAQKSGAPDASVVSVQESLEQSEKIINQDQGEVSNSQTIEENPIDKGMSSVEKINQLAAEKETPAGQSKAISREDTSAFPTDARSSRKTSLTPEQAKVAVGIFAGLFLIIIIISILGYVYSALCLYFIATKTSIEPAWLAWIPIANAFLMCKIAGVSYLWLLGLLIAFLPVIGILGSIYSIGLFIYLWYKIILVRNKPAWLVILMFIPVANLIVMGYLAFSE